MTQKTNLNISPYYDDFDSEKNFYKVLFKPGYPVQARELTSLQSILQGQVESFGGHMFKEGSVIIPGNLTYDGQFYAVKLNSSNLGVDISLYINNFIGKKITGQVSGTTAKIQHVEISGANVDDITIYVKYIDSDDNFVFTQFQDGESLSATENVEYGNTTIVAGTPFASLISSNATSIGSAASIQDGVFFVRGYFVNIAQETIILDYYTNTPSYRVGLKVDEVIVNAKEDDSLFDNAKGFTNYAAPGADRFKISLSLTKKLLTDTNDTDFIEILRVKNGRIQKFNSKTQYNIIRDYLAERTYDESGDYTIDQFNPSIHNSLNDRLGNNGVYFNNEKTEDGNTPSDDLMCLKVSPGKAYVRGYDVEKIGTTIIDADKPRDTEIISNSSIPFNMGNLLKVNNVTGTPKQRATIDLYNRLVGDSGAKIGDARVYTINLTSSEYSNGSTEYDLRLYDIQTYTKLTLNQSVDADDIPTTAFVKGKNSGASGYAVYAGGNSEYIYLRQTSGNFVKGEGLIVNGIEISRIIKEFVVYGTQNIKSVKQTGASGYPDFTADSVLERFRMPGSINQITIPGVISGVATVAAGGLPFAGIGTDTIISYQRSGFSTETYNRVTSVSSNKLTIGISSIANSAINGGIGAGVTGVFDGQILTGTNDSLVTPYAMGPIISNEGGLYVELPDYNVSTVDLTGSTLTISEQITGEATDGSGELTFDLSSVGITSAAYEAFDEERYSVTYSTGIQAPIARDQFELSNNIITIRGLRDSQSNVVVDTTLSKFGIQSKVKQYNRSASLVVSRSKYKQSGVGVNTSNSDGLTYNKYYGVRVQDEEISLNYPDVAKVVSVYESLDSSDPTLDEVQFTSTASVHTNAIVGEHIVGNTSKAIARVVSSPSANTLKIVYLTGDKLSTGETVVFDESKLTTEIEIITSGSYKIITDSFSLDKGQKDQYYDYSRLVRNNGVSEPAKRLLIVFDYYSVPSTDDGDVFTVLSYDKERFTEDIPNIGPSNIRASDTLDFRPRVAVFDPSATTGSPFDFSSRNFDSVPKYLLKSDESSILGYEYYLPRIDKLYLDKFGKFVVEKGISEKTPKAPEKNDELMQVATINLPPYLYNPQDASLTLIDNRRFTMRDIGFIEDRVKNLEQVTTLSLLEIDTQTLQIQDADGRNRFKSGFFVDPFNNYSLMNTKLSSIQINPVTNELIPIVSRNSIASQLATLEVSIPENEDFGENYPTIDPNIQKTGNAVTLKYEEIDWLEQTMATKSVNVNPFNVVVYNGTVELSPRNDTWVRTIQLEDNNIRITRSDIFTQNIDIQGRDVLRTNRRQEGDSGRVTSSNVTTEVSTRQTITENAFSVDDVNTRNQLVSTGSESFMRSRNTEFVVSNLKPSTRYYQFLDGNSGVNFIPKLIEIATDSSLNTYGASDAFSVGETVIGTVDGVQLINFRVSSPRHKFGQYNNSSSIYNINPYNKSETISESYSSSSNILNVDTKSLSNEAQGLYSGYLTQGMRLVGQESGAVAYVKDLRLISDNYGDIIGTFFLKDPNASPVPAVRIETGTKTFKLTSSSTNERGVPGSNVISFAESRYTSQGNVNRWQNEVTTTTTNFDALTNVNTFTNVTTENVEYSDPLAQSFIVGGNVQAPSDIDLSDDVNGVFLTSIDLYFNTIDSGNAPVKIQVRTVELGLPTLNTIGKTVTVRPTTTDANGNLIPNIQTSTDGSVATNVKFPEPIYLAPGREYAIVVISENSDEYRLFAAEMGEKSLADIDSNIPPDENALSAVYSRQFALGSLFKSQNGSIWSPNQREDLKFKLYKANFTSDTGTAFFYNPDLNESNDYILKLNNDPIRTLTKTATIGITTVPGSDSSLVGILTVGQKIAGVSDKGGSAIIVGRGSSVSNLGIKTTETGVNYTTDSSVDTFNFVGSGSGLKLNITNVDSTTGAIEKVAFTNVKGERGTGYQIGDVIGIVTSTAGNQGSGAQITIAGISTDIDTLFVENIEGETGSVGSGKEFAKQSASAGFGLSYYSDATGGIVGLTTYKIRESTSTGGIRSGNYFKVSHFDHGMYSNTNKVTLNDIESSVAPTTLSSALSNIETTLVSVANTSNLSTFEGQNVSATNPGYIKIGNEIVKYNAVGSGTLTIDTDGRGTDSTIVSSHDNKSLVYKYELNGVSLRRINKTHTVAEPITIDDYHIAVDMSANGVNRSVDGTPAGFPRLQFSNESSVGGENVRATENISYTALVPSYDVITPGSLTSISGQIRTVTGTSAGGSEGSFNDSGFEPVGINVLNSLTSPRLVCSKINESTYLSGLPRSKSFTTGINFTSSDSNLSPILYLDTAFTEFRNSRLDKPIVDYPIDGRVNSILDDPHAAIYVSNTVNLNNPATSIKVILSAYRHSSADFRVLYSLIKADSSEVEQSFQLFPGYDNLSFNNEDGFTIVDESKNSGLPDTFVPASLSNQFLEYQFTANNLELFTGYTIKIVMSGTNQAYPPRLKELRTIAIR